MFGWFRPTCPVEPHAKRWIEERLRWLSDQFGFDVFTQRTVILPLAEFFPDPYDGSDGSVRALLDRVCGYMDADPGLVEMELYTNPHDLWLVNDRGKYLPKAAGTYRAGSSKTVIRLDTGQIAEPMVLVGTMAHRACPSLVSLGEKRIQKSIFDNELLTDLTVVFHGLGIFLANGPRAWESQMTTWPSTNVRRPKYMTQPMFGYALAHAAWLRGERKPKWARHLRMDANCSFRQGLHYLWETGDSSLAPRIAQLRKTAGTMHNEVRDPNHVNPHSQDNDCRPSNMSLQCKLLMD